MESKDWKCKVSNTSDFIKGYEKGRQEGIKSERERILKEVEKIIDYMEERIKNKNLSANTTRELIALMKDGKQKIQALLPSTNQDKKVKGKSEGKKE